MRPWQGFSKITSKDEEKQRRGDSARHSWYKSGKRQGRRGKSGGVSGHQRPQQFNRNNRTRPPRPTGTMRSLRPVNIKGNRARGMRAPKNTNQFLMHEKYQMLHMRSDSIGTDSGSDSELDFTDMDSYLRVLENARGALLDSPDLSPRRPVQFFPRQLAKCQQQYPFFPFQKDFHQEESLQYYPSEDDVMQSEDFMQKDFIEFCDTFSGSGKNTM